VNLRNKTNIACFLLIAGIASLNGQQTAAPKPPVAEPKSTAPGEPQIVPFTETEGLILENLAKEREIIAKEQELLAIRTKAADAAEAAFRANVCASLHVSVEGCEIDAPRKLKRVKPAPPPPEPQKGSKPPIPAGAPARQDQ
jgi:hypothetical protein